jgi:hypothetical protein
MDETGADIFLDVHGDEDLPVNFLAGAQGTPNWGKRMESLHGAFLASYCRCNSEMEQSVGYTHQDPDKVVVNTATKVVATCFNSLSCTLEMPFRTVQQIQNPNEAGVRIALGCWGHPWWNHFCTSSPCCGMKEPSGISYQKLMLTSVLSTGSTHTGAIIKSWLLDRKLR